MAASQFGRAGAHILEWLPMIGLGIWGVWPPARAHFLIANGTVAWFVGCIECRLTLVPHAGFNTDAKRPAENQPPQA